MSHLVFLILGLATGAAYCLIALGLVLTHRGSGVINFAHGAFAMFGAYAFLNLRDNGQLILPFVPTTVHVGSTAPTWLALVWALAVGGLLGLVSYFLVFRPLRRAPMLANVVASVGILISLQATAVLQLGSNNVSTSPVFPSAAVSIGGAKVPQDRFYLAGLSVVAAAVLTVLYRYTRFGVATRAAASNERGAILLGYNPARLAAVNWVIASMFAALAGVVLVPISGVDATTMTLLIVPALGAAMIARLTSFPVAALAGLAIGAVQSELLNLQTASWFPGFAKTGTVQGLPFLVVIAVLILAGRRLPARGFSSARLPSSRAATPRAQARTAVVGLILLTALVFLLSSNLVLALFNSMVISIIMLSLVVLTGFVGQISLAQAAMAGVAGFTLSKVGGSWGVPFPLAPILAVAVATAVGVLVGLPALRVRGVQLAVVTLAGAVAVQEFLFKNPSFTGGLQGSRVPSPSLGGLDLGVRSGSHFPRPVFGILLAVVLTLTALAVVNLRRGITGLRMLGLRANETAAAAVGINVAAMKLVAFGMASAIAAVGGALLGYLQTNLSFGSFDVFVGLGWLALAYLGGIASVSGALIGGALAAGGLLSTILDDAFGFGRYVQLISGLGLVLTAVLNRDGIAGGVALSWSQFQQRRRLPGRVHPAVPTRAATAGSVTSKEEPHVPA